jgi:hypothetical protein
MYKSHALIIVIASIYLQACGVKTDPIPPIQPVDIGTGKPMYKPSKTEENKKSIDTESDEDDED